MVTAERVWFARLNRGLDRLPLADPVKVRLVHEILYAAAYDGGSRGPAGRALWDELGAYVGVGACPWSPDDA
jgi:hypothetical protein